MNPLIKTTLAAIKEKALSLFNEAMVTLTPLLQVFYKKALVLYHTLLNNPAFLNLFLLAVSIATINWAIWLIRRARSTFYRPTEGKFNASVSVVIPVYRENKNILEETMDQILKNNPKELIVVLDHSEKELLEFLGKIYHDDNRVKLHFIAESGKRPALAKGIRLAKGEIVVLVDSDTSWKSTDFLQTMIIPFKDPKVGGVGTRQEVKIRESWAQKVIDWNLDLKYSDYIKSDSLSGSVLCLSGRTAAYRRSVILPLLDQLVNEKFLWHKCLGGDDTRLTSLVLKAGYECVYQDNAVAQSIFHPSIMVYLQQKVRWSRNSFRAYLRAMFSIWPWKQRRIVYLISAYHTIFPGLTALVGVAFFAYALYLQEFLFAYLWLGWIVVARLIRGYSHLIKKPRDLYLLPVVVIYYYVLSFIKLYSLLTLTKESWSGSRGSYKIKKGERVVEHNDGDA